MKVDLEIYNCGWDGAYSYIYPGPTITTNEIIEIETEKLKLSNHRQNSTVSSAPDLS